MNRMNVCYASDDKYCTYMGVSIVSLLENNKSFSEIVVYVLDDGISEKNKILIESMVKSYGGDGKRTVKFIGVSRAVKRLEKLGVNSWGNGFTAYSRLFIDVFIDSAGAARVLYLDCDTIVNGSLSEFYNSDLEGKVFASVRDYWAGKNYRKQIGLENYEPYCNSGVMLIDMDKWIKFKCRKRMVDHIKNKRAKYLFPDQDIINIVLKGQYLVADLKYNFCPEFMLFSPSQIRLMHGRTKKDYYSSEVIEGAKRNPVIIHYVGIFTLKPWCLGHRSPLTHIWERYLKMSPWRGLKKLKYDLPLHKRVCITMKKVFPQSMFCLVYRVISGLYKVIVAVKSNFDS